MPCTDQRIQKLDEDSLRNLTEGTGPCNECICNLIVPPKEPFNLRNKLRSACTTIHMCKDSTAKRLRGKGPNNLAGCSEEESGSGGKAGKAGKPGKEQKSKGKNRSIDLPTSMTLEQVRKLDEYSLKRIRSGEGPCDECICHILSMPEDRSPMAAIKRRINCVVNKVRGIKETYDSEGSLGVLKQLAFGKKNKRAPPESPGASGKKGKKGKKKDKKKPGKVSPKGSKSSNRSRSSNKSRKGSPTPSKASKNSKASSKSSSGSVKKKKNCK